MCPRTSALPPSIRFAVVTAKVDFHLSRGADFVSLHWRAEESPEALASSFGLLATFNYKQATGWRHW